MTDHAVYHPGSPRDREREKCERCDAVEEDMRPGKSGMSEEVFIRERGDGKRLCQECYEIYGC